jgi:hypothetical protein
MTALAELHAAVRAAVASGRLGRPVFVRQTQAVEKAEDVLPALVRSAAAVGEWLGQAPEQLYALGSVDAGQVSLTLRFRGGATALVSVSRSPPRGDGVDVMVLGDHGALYHDAGAADLWDQPATDEPPPNRALRGAIERALRSGRPEPVGGGGQP